MLLPPMSINNPPAEALRRQRSSGLSPEAIGLLTVMKEAERETDQILPAKSLFPEHWHFENEYKQNMIDIAESAVLQCLCQEVYIMTNNRLWIISILVIVAISLISVVTSFAGGHLPDFLTRVFGILDLAAVFVLVFTTVRKTRNK